MPEVIESRFLDTTGLQGEIDGWVREVAEHIYMRAILGPAQRVRVQAEVEILVTDLRSGVNAFLNNGGSTALTAGTGSPFSFTGSFDSATLIVNSMDGEFRDLAEKIYARVRARDATRAQSEIETLVTDLKNATNGWLNSGGSVTLTAGAGAPYNVNF
jgi:hypothetical protein